MTRKETLERVVTQMLAKEPEAPWSHIEVVAEENGVVHLHGSVPTPDDAYSAELTTALVPGVTEVDSDLTSMVGVGP